MIWHGNCVDGSCLIATYPKGQKMLCDTQQRDKILAHDGGEATVLCVIQTSGFRGDLPLVHLPGGCRITAGHPIRINTTTTGHQAYVQQGQDQEFFTDLDNTKQTRHPPNDSMHHTLHADIQKLLLFLDPRH
eukprot:15526556-Heterocapsa_arctica.AAC.1